MADATGVAQSPGKPPIKPKPRPEVLEAARLLKAQSDPSASMPIGLSGENSPSMPPRRLPPGVPVSKGRGAVINGSTRGAVSQSMSCTAVASGDRSSPRPASSPYRSASGQSTPTTQSATQSPERVRMRPNSADVSSAASGRGATSALPSFSSGSEVEVDSDNEENENETPASEDGPPGEGGVFFGLVTMSNVQTSSEPQKEEDESETKSMTKEEKRAFKMKKTVEELMSTEQSYVFGLQLLAKDLKATLEQAQQDGTCKDINAEKMRLIFGVLPEIYGIHLTLLDEISQRVANWDESPKIGDIMLRFGPFLKVYGNFTMNFEQAIKTVSDMGKADKKFKMLIADFERQPKCKMLGIAHYMLTPVQRIPRYNLLLREYLKWSPEDHADRPAAEKALEEISVAADRADQQIKELECFNRVMMVQLSIVDKAEIVQPGAILIRHGSLMKTSRKSFQHRYFFLFNNMLIHTHPVTNQPFGGGGQYKFRDRLPLIELRVEEQLVSPLPHAFTITSRSRSLCVAASSAEEKDEWIKDLNECVGSWRKIQTTRLKGDDGTDCVDGDDDSRLGKVAPVWLHDSSTSMCMICAQNFTVFLRRHHCRCCGNVCCSSCSGKEAYLEYCGKKDRVCDRCFNQLAGTEETVDKKRGKSVPGVRELKGYDKDSACTGYLHLKSGLRWKRYWFQVRDLALFWYRAPEDVVAQGSKPLPGHDVECLKKGSHGADREHSFRIYHKSIGTILLCGDSEEERDRWVSVLMDAIKGV